MESTRPAQSTTNRDGSVTCNWGKVCKNKRGLAIHQGKSGFQCVRSSGQCIASLASETQEYPSLDSNHSTEELSVKETAPDVFREPEEDEDPLLELLQNQSSFDTEQETGPDRPQQDTATRPRKPRIKWSKASNITLETTGRGPRQHPRGISTRTSGQETHNPYHSVLLYRKGEVWT